MGMMIDVNALVKGGLLKVVTVPMNRASGDRATVELNELRYQSHDGKNTHGYEWQVVTRIKHGDLRVLTFEYESDGWDHYYQCVRQYDCAVEKEA